jgi:hypothetical protein
VGNWLRDVTLSLVRRSEDDWIGPAFRDHSQQPAVGNLETAHLTWGIATVVDLAADAFSDVELDEVKTILAERGLTMCRRWIDSHHHLANWRAVLSACDAASPECVRLLIKHGADVNVISKLNDGWTPLMKACRKGDVGSARELITAGADIKTCPKNGWGALLQVSFFMPCNYFGWGCCVLWGGFCETP